MRFKTINNMRYLGILIETKLLKMRSTNFLVLVLVLFNKFLLRFKTVFKDRPAG